MHCGCCHSQCALGRTQLDDCYAHTSRVAEDGAEIKFNDAFYESIYVRGKSGLHGMGMHGT